MQRHNLRVQTLRPRKRDNGHSVVRVESWTKTPVLGIAERRALTCECGKRMTGYGDRALYAHGQHVRREEG